MHLVLELCEGIDLFRLVSTGILFSEEQAKFYFSEILLALEFLHEHDVVY